MKTRFSQLSFRHRLTTAFLAVGVIPLVVCVALLLNIFRLSLTRNTREAADSQLTALNSGFSALLGSCESVLDTLNAQPLTAEALTKGASHDTRVYGLLYSAAAPYLKEADFALYDSTGELLYTTGRSGENLSLPTDWGLLWAAGQTEDTVYRSVSAYDSGERGAMELCRAIRQDGSTVGYAVVRLLSSHFAALFEGRYTAGNGVLVLDAHWNEVYASPSLQESELAQQLRACLLNGQALAGESNSTYTVTRQAESGFYIVLQQPRPLADWASRLFSLTAAFSVLLCLGLSLAVALWFSRQLFRPIRSLNSAMAEVEEGNLDIRMEVQGTDELSQLAGRFNRMTLRLKENLEQSLLQQQELNDTQVRMMQAQLNPHFLYNTLDTLKWLGKIYQAPEVSTISADLAHILRQSISGESFVPLSQELLLLERYVEIQQIRFPGKFVYTQQTDEDISDILIPRLMLQPLVENAIIHGFEDGSRGTVTVEARQRGEELILTVRDDGCGMSAESRERFLSQQPSKTGRHLGLYNVDAILRLHYGADRGLRLLSLPDERGTCIQAILPIRRQEGAEPL